MNDTLDAPAILTSQQIKIPADDKRGRANEVSAVKKFFMPIAPVLGNIVRFAAGPPMSEREHGNRALAEVRARAFDGLASELCRPH